MESYAAYRNQLFTILIACMTVTGVGLSVGWSSPSLKKLAHGVDGLKLSNDQKSWVASSHELGHFLSPVPAALLAGKISRRNSLLLANIFLAIGWGIVAGTRSYSYLITAQVLFGLAMGIVFTIVPIYICEVASPKIRGALSTAFQATLYFGHLIEFCVGPWSSYAVLAWLSLSLTFLFFAFVWKMAESPHHLVRSGKEHKARSAIAWLKAVTTDHAAVERELHHVKEFVNKEKANCMLLFKGPNLRAILIVAMVAVAQRWTGMSAITAYAASTFPSTAGGLTSDEYTILFGLAVFITTFFSAALIDLAGRRPAILASCAGCCLAHLASALAFYVHSHPNWLPALSVTAFAVLYSLGLGPLVTTLQGELFPPQIKELASSTTTLAHAAASFAVTKLFQVIRDDPKLGMPVNFLIFAGCCAISFVFSYFLVPETKSKTLKEVQDQQNKVQINVAEAQSS